MKNFADLGGCYPPRPSASVDNTLLGLQKSSYPTQPHSIIAKYFFQLLSGPGSLILKSDWLIARTSAVRIPLTYRSEISN